MIELVKTFDRASDSKGGATIVILPENVMVLVRPVFSSPVVTPCHGGSKERGSSQVRAIAVTQGVALGYSMAPRKSGAQAPSRDARLVLRFVDAPV
ncbi:MAG: hypothetical protein ACPL7J_08250, partial [Desulfomonilaceae bacterium]